MAAWIVFAVATLLRLAFALFVHPPGDFIFSDMWVYDHRAGRLLSGNLTAWDSFTPVGYPGLLAAIYAVAGRNFTLIAALHAVMGGASAALTLAIGKRLGGRVAPILAAAIVAVHPGLILYAGLLLSETTFTLLLLATLWLLLRSAETDALVTKLAAGLMLGLATIVRPNLLALFPLLMLWLWVAHGRRFRPALWHAALVLPLALVPLALASAHNSRLVGRPAGPATNGGLNFYLNFAEVRSIRCWDQGLEHNIQPVPNYLRYQVAEDSERPFYDERYYYRRGLSLLVEKPLRLLRALTNFVEGSGVGRQRYWPGYKPVWWLLAGASVVFFMIAIVPTLLYLGLTTIRGRLLDPASAPRLLLASAVVSSGLTLWLFLGDPRVRVPFDPVFAVLGMDALRRAAGWFVDRRRRTRVTALREG
jgi:4-amino-4-deoxy-L-arabinose transferase-like glycosyltransferase